MIHIVVTPDDNYVMPTAVLITSIFENNPGEQFTFHIVGTGLTADNTKFLTEHIETRYGGKAIFYRVSPDDFSRLPLKATDHVSVAAYFRLVFSEVLPADIDKIIYMDGDVIVRDSIRPMWDTDISGYALGALVDDGFSMSAKYERLGYPPEDEYFCTGVMILNLDYWRKVDAKKLFFDFIAKNYEKIQQHDQDVLNGVFHDKWLHLSFRWGYMDGYQHYRSEEDYFRDRDKTSAHYPVVIHYTAVKPWKVRCRNFFKYEFEKYYELTYGHPLRLKMPLSLRLRQTAESLFGRSRWQDKYLRQGTLHGR